MSATTALQRLAEQVAVISSEYRKLKKRCSELEKRLPAASTNRGNSTHPVSSQSELGNIVSAESLFDRKQVKAKLEKMLAELADIK